MTELYLYDISIQEVKIHTEKSFVHEAKTNTALVKGTAMPVGTSILFSNHQKSIYKTLLLTNIVHDEKGDLVTDSHSILARWRNHYQNMQTKSSLKVD